jgi:hypothetical protein
MHEAREHSHQGVDRLILSISFHCDSEVMVCIVHQAQSVHQLKYWPVGPTVPVLTAVGVEKAKLSRMSIQVLPAGFVHQGGQWN